MQIGLLNTFAQPGAPLAFVVHAATVFIAAAVAYGAGGGFAAAGMAAMAPIVVAVSAIGGGLLVARLVGRYAVWERQLAGFAEDEIDAFAAPAASGSSAADFGWNRLLEQGRRWQAVAELERAVANNRSDNSDGDAGPLLDALADGVVAVDAAGTILRANAMMAAICAVDSPAELRGQTLAEALGADDAVTAPLGEPTSQVQDVVEWTLTAGSGSTRTLRGSRRPVTSDDGQAATHVWTIRDVTQQRLAESMREQFLSAATHEFRTPLANIRAYAESLDMGPDIEADARKRFYNVIQSESLRLSQLVDDLLDISRMQAGALALDSRETELGRLVEDAAAQIQGQIQEKNQQLRCELPPKFPKAAVDKSKLSAALINLLGNASKYTPEGGQVTFRVEIGSQQVEFSVTDTGIGIAAEELPHVFERFYRSGDDRVRAINGSGLGLALSQEIARLHGGEITVESAVDKGSTFRMSIPLDSAV